MKRRTKIVRFGLLPLCIFAAAMMLYTMSAQAASAGKYSIADAVRLVKYLTCQNTELTSEQAQLLDIDGNQKLSAVDMTLLKRILIYGEAEEKENTTSTTTESTTTTTTTESVTTTIVTSTTVSATTTETAHGNQGSVNRRDVTTPNGGIIPEATFNTLVEFAQENGIESYDIRWTGGERIPNTVIVLGNKSSTNYVCEGAFWIYRGTDFCEMFIDYLDPIEDFQEIDDLTNYEFVAWRHCNEKYMKQYPYNELSYCFDGRTDIRYFKWTQYEDIVYWALIPSITSATESATTTTTTNSTTETTTTETVIQFRS